MFVGWVWGDRVLGCCRLKLGWVVLIYLCSVISLVVWVRKVEMMVGLKVLFDWLVSMVRV